MQVLVFSTFKLWATMASHVQVVLWYVVLCHIDNLCMGAAWGYRSYLLGRQFRCVYVQVLVADVDSHRVFRMISDLNALAVLLRQGGHIPAPYQLAASLKQQQSWDSK